jgi:hypothetical protein
LTGGAALPPVARRPIAACQGSACAALSPEPQASACAALPSSTTLLAPWAHFSPEPQDVPGDACPACGGRFFDFDAARALDTQPRPR